jgi:starch phosphorylase
MSADRNGFDIPSFDDDPDYERRDRREASAAFDVIENHIVPSFYGRGDDGLPHDWLDRITTNWATLGWNVIATRMVRDYVQQLYEPAAVSSDSLTADGGARARELASWKQHVTDSWPGVRITVDEGASDIVPAAAGEGRTLTAHVDSGALTLDDLLVQAVHGPISPDGSFDEERMRVLDLTSDGTGRFTATFVPDRAGRWGVSVRARCSPTSSPPASSPSADRSSFGIGRKRRRSARARSLACLRCHRPRLPSATRRHRRRCSSRSAG